MKVLAIDYGEKRLGLALGDTGIDAIIPLTPVKRITAELDLTLLKKIIGDYEIEQIVIGYPFRLDGSKGRMARKVEKFASLLKKELNIDIVFGDERLSSFEGEQMIGELEIDMKKKISIIDSMAAWVILRNYLRKK